MAIIKHILNRGVEKRKIFLDESDYCRFADNLYDFNDKHNVSFSYRNRRKYLYDSLVTITDKRRKSLVDILCWTLMPNHYHFLTVDKIEDGTSLLSKKIAVGYTMYFNLKNERSGVLFQGRTKIIPIVKDAHYLHLPFYILSNPLKLFQPDWKKEGIDDPEKAFRFLKNYKWSAMSDLFGENCFRSITNKELFYELFNTNKERLKNDFLGWLKTYR